MHELGRDNRRLAYRALRAVLHALPDRMTVEEAAHLSAELPMLVLTPQEAAKAVFLCLNRHLNPSQARQARDMMQGSIRRLWPETRQQAA